MPFTKNQEVAMTLSGQNIIVSAGAGSGKTAVLTERIYRKVLKGQDLNRLLVLTFTNKAAKEMKERIKKRLIKGELYDLLSQVDSCYITTFDSFSLSMVKKYHYLLNVNRNLNIVDGALIELKEKEILNEVFDKYYELSLKGEAKEFKTLITEATKKSDEPLKEEIMSMIENLNKIYDKETYLKTYLDTHFTDEILNQKYQLYMDALNLALVELNGVAEDLYDDCSGTKYGDKLRELMAMITADNDYDTLVSFFNNLSFPRLMDSDDSTKIKKKIFTDLYKRFMSSYLVFDSSDDLKQSFETSKTYTKAIIDIIADYYEKLDSYKKEMGLYDFNDIAMMSLDLVKKFPKVKEELKNSFDEILLDEYQDTSDLQEAFIKEISEDNCYMVGDIKQSIYLFRNANPQIFKEKYDKYTPYELLKPGEKAPFGIRIDLLENFRSTKQVLSNINLIFNDLMTDEFGNANYKDEHQMNYGNHFAYHSLETNPFYNMEFLTYKPDPDKLLSKEEIEIFTIGNEIKTLLAGDFQVYDKDLDSYRKIEYKDIAIIPDRTRDFDTYQAIFTFLGIPLDVIRNEQMFDKELLRIFNAIFNAIKYFHDYPNYSYYYVSVARSFLRQEKDDDILKDSLTYFKDSELTSIFKRLYYYAKEHDAISTFNLILEEFLVYDKLILIGDVERNLKLISYLANVVTNLSKVGYDTFEVALYLEDSLEKAVNLSESNKGTGLGVQLLNIHQSKGLEYPICFFAGLTAKFNQADLKSNFLFDKNIGFVTASFYHEQVIESIEKVIYRMEKKLEDISEKIRLFYVAVTRAREKMYFLLPDINEMSPKNLGPAFFNSFSDFCYYYYDKFVEPYLRIINYEGYADPDYSSNRVYRYQESLEKGEAVSFNLKPYHGEVLEKGVISKKISKLINEDEVELLNYGTKLHAALETLDLKNPDLTSLELSQKEFKVLSKVLTLPCFKDLDQAKVYQEKEFYYELGKETYHGIIDLLIERESSFEIIDYKLYNVYSKEYLVQLSAYANYLKTLTNKPIKTYLLSILKGELVEVDLEATNDEFN